jgi:hypothetical protein
LQIRKELKISTLSNKIIPSTLLPQKALIAKWLLIGYIARLVFMSLWATMDTMSIVWISFLFIKTNQLLPSSYPPFLFYLYRFFFTLTQPILPANIISFLSSGVNFTPPTDLLDLSTNQFGIRTLLFVSKSPYLAFDFAAAVLFLHLLNDEKKSMLALKLWMSNPFLVYVSYLFGQYDIIPVFFIVLALYFLKKQKIHWTMFSLGLGAAFKLFSLLFIPPIILIYTKGKRSFLSKLKSSFKLFGISLLPLILSVALSAITPIYYESANLAISSYYPYHVNGFFGTTLYNRGVTGNTLIVALSLYIFDYSISLSTLTVPLDVVTYDVIYVFPVIYFLLLLGVLYLKNWSFDGVWKALSVFLLLYYSITLFHIQWFLWIQPFFVLLIAGNREKFLKLYLLLIPLYAAYILYWIPSALSFIESLGLPSVKVINLFRAFFSATCIFIAFLVVKNKLKEIIHI